MKCSVCSGELRYLGKLGRLYWFRCENCGLEFSTEVEENPEEEE